MTNFKLKEEIGQLTYENNRLERENRALIQGLWDEYFKVAMPATLLNGSGVKAAAEIADEAVKVRMERAARSFKKEA